MTSEILNAAIVAVTGISITGFVLPRILPETNDTVTDKLPVLQRLSILPMSLFVCILSFVVGLATGHHETAGNEFGLCMFFGLGTIMLLYVGGIIYIAHGVPPPIRIIVVGLLFVGGFGIYSMPRWSACLLTMALVMAICYTLDFVNVSDRLRLTLLALILFCLGNILFCLDKYPYGLFAVAVAGVLTPLVFHKCENHKKLDTIKTRIPAIGTIIALLLFEVI